MPASFASLDSESETHEKRNPHRFSRCGKRSKQSLQIATVYISRLGRRGAVSKKGRLKNPVAPLKPASTAADTAPLINSEATLVVMLGFGPLRFIAGPFFGQATNRSWTKDGRHVTGEQLIDVRGISCFLLCCTSCALAVTLAVRHLTCWQKDGGNLGGY